MAIETATETEERRISHSPKRNLPRTESEVRGIFTPRVHACIQHARSSHEQISGVTICKAKCGSFTVRRDHLLNLQSFTTWLPNTYLAFYWRHWPQLFSKATIHAKTATNKSILTQRDELQRVVDAREVDKSQAVFIACSNDVCK